MGIEPYMVQMILVLAVVAGLARMLFAPVRRRSTTSDTDSSLSRYFEIESPVL